jgi:hypothetical protein
MMPSRSYPKERLKGFPLDLIRKAILKKETDQPYERALWVSFIRSSRSNSFEISPQAHNAGPPVFREVFEHSDQRKRLQMMLNHDTDIWQC